jgi:hypothetical protein
MSLQVRPTVCLATVALVSLLLLLATPCRSQPGPGTDSDLQAYWLKLKEEYAPRFEQVKTDEEERQLEQEMRARYDKEVARRGPATRSSAVVLKGDLVDDAGSPVNGVTVTIEKPTPFLSADAPRPHPEVLTANGHFDLSYPCSSMVVTFTKSGYYGAKVNIDADPRWTQESFARLIRRGILVPPDKLGAVRIVLVKIVNPTKLQAFAGFSSGEGWETSLVDFGKEPATQSKPEELVKITDPKDVPANCAVALMARDPGTGAILTLPLPKDPGGREFPAGAWLYLNAPGGGFLLHKPKYPAACTRDMKEAPQEGYGPELVLPPETLQALARITATGSLDPEQRVYFYFKTADGKYGKGRVGAAMIDRKRKIFWLGVRLFVQPDGSRNLEDPTIEQQE